VRTSPLRLRRPRPRVGRCRAVRSPYGRQRRTECAPLGLPPRSHL